VVYLRVCSFVVIVGLVDYDELCVLLEVELDCLGIVC